jgi:hypothetical protein
MIGAWLASTAACRVPGLVPRGGREVGARFILTRVAPTGAVMALAIYTGNSVYLFLSGRALVGWLVGCFTRYGLRTAVVRTAACLWGEPL